MSGPTADANGENMRRRVMYWPDDLWELVQDAADRRSQLEGKRVSAAEWVRETVTMRLERQART